MIEEKPCISKIASSFTSLHSQHLEPHIFDLSFNVSKMIRLVGLSRTSLHRELKKRTGYSATQFIHQLRLRKASRLLTENIHMPIVEIALMVGFEDHSYFSKKFKEHFQISPSRFREISQKPKEIK